ncbi:tRNA pseudouridine synthase D, partial [Aphelenchoides avenae]
MESECGLSEYAIKGEFSSVICELKRLYSDFVVNEILLDGALALPSVSEAEPLKKEEANLSKDERRETHEYIRNAYPRKLCSNGMDGAIVIKPHGSDRNDRKRQAWPNDRPDYLHFTLTKENKDTQYALNIISRLSGLNQKVFGTAGTKDRRAVTSQRVSAYRVETERLLKLNRQLRGMFLSNFEYAGRELKLGDLWGNRFSIVLRGIDESLRQDIEERLLRWKETGFINYFGTQRFGSCGSMNVQTGRLILTQKWQEAVEAILQPRAEATGSLKECLTKYAETKDAQAALKELKGGVSYASVEAILLKSLAKQPTGFKNAVMALPRNMRSLYVHAYQSCVFNIIASRRARQFGLKVLEGDVNENGADLTSSSAIEDVALPLPSAKPVMPKNELAKWYEEIFESDGVSGDSFEQLQKEFAIGQVLRKFLERPRDVKWEFLNYTDRSQPLQPGLNELIANRSKPPIGSQ